jgi:hypothetical protein
MLDDTWRDSIIKEQTKDAVKQSGGHISEITLDELSDTYIQGGVRTIPDTIHIDLITKIQQACASHHRHNQGVVR